MSGEKILILDDDPDLVEALRIALREEGFDVHTRLTRDPTDVATIMPDLVIVDAPPGVTGLAINFVQIVRLRRETMRMPVILTCCSLRDIEPGLLRDRRIHVVVKPFDLDVLLGAIRGLLNPAPSSHVRAPT